MYRGWPFAIGWAMVILIDLALSNVIMQACFFHLFVDKDFETIIEESNPLSLFIQSHLWYIWLMSAVSSLVFSLRGTMMLKKQEEDGTIQLLSEQDAEEK